MLVKRLKQGGRVIIGDMCVTFTGVDLTRYSGGDGGDTFATFDVEGLYGVHCERDKSFDLTARGDDSELHTATVTVRELYPGGCELAIAAPREVKIQ